MADRTEMLTEAIKRVTEMEKIMDEALEVMNNAKEHQDRFLGFQPQIKRLEEYYSGQDWKDDFVLDEAGELPKELKRGVLSEDGIYDVLERNKELLKTMSIIVRRAQKQDIPAIMELLEQVNRVHHDGRPDLFKLATKYTEEELEAILENDETPVFVADRDGQVLGHGFCILQRPENTRLLHDRLTLYIDDICVSEKARRQKVGNAIYEHIIDYATGCGCYNVTLNAWSCNPGAIKFYENLGLVPYKIGMEKIL